MLSRRTFASLLVAFSVTLAALSARAQAPNEVPYQGYLTDTDGVPVSNQSAALTFRLYDQPSGGTTLWQEAHEVVTVTDGVFSVRLGSIEPFGSLEFDGSLYLSVAVGDGNAEELAPRVPLGAVPFSLMAEQSTLARESELARRLAGSALRAGRNVTITEKTDGALEIAASGGDDGSGGAVGDGHSLDAPDGDPVDALLVDEKGRVGIGTDSPTSPLTVAGLIESSEDGFKFPDGSVQATAATSSETESGWSLTGNAGTDPQGQFLGTTDEVPLEIRVAGSRVMRYEPETTEKGPNVLGGFRGNSVTEGVMGATIGGGGSPSEVDGNPSPNRVTNDYGTIGGGFGNTAGGATASVGGGFSNEAAELGATVGGGGDNEATEPFTTIGGGRDNTADGSGATVSGGGFNQASESFATVAGGRVNTAEAFAATVGGGDSNKATEEHATVAGGRVNTAEAFAATVGGGDSNKATEFGATVAGGRVSTASGAGATVGGGDSNVAAGRFSTVPGGLRNEAGGDYSFAAGHGATVRDASATGDNDGDEGTFVWVDARFSPFPSTGPNQFLIRAAGGVGIGTNSPSSPLTVAGIIESTDGGFIFPDGTVQSTAANVEAFSLPFEGTNATSEPGMKVANSGTGFGIEVTGDGVGALSASGTGDALGLFASAVGINPAMRAVAAGKGPAIEAVAISTGIGISARKNASSGNGMVAAFDDRVTDNAEPAILITARTNVLAMPALKVQHAGRGTAGRFEVTNTVDAAVGSAISALNRGAGVAVQGDANGTATGSVGVWGLASSGSDALPLKATQNGRGDDIAVFQVRNTNVARIDNTGKGFFNGGTQTGGADLAEAFEVEGPAAMYEPGDVLVISTRTDRTLEKSTLAYSTLVVGVYATKPGVLLSERDIDDSLDDTVPTGVVGVIPTKVSGENGPIRRGDQLVTGTMPGHAMKADMDALGIGMVLGKALENFDGPGSGIINVFVNAK